MIVVDASVVLELLLRTPAGLAAEERLLAPNEGLHAPHLVDVEVAQVLRRYVVSGHLSGQRGSEAVDDLGDLPLQRHPHTILLSRIWQHRNNLSAYDAAYVALAEALDAPLFTRDRRLRSAAGEYARIELL